MTSSSPVFYLRDVWVEGRLRGVTLEIGRGVTAVVGPNGSGKTTLLRVLAGALKPDRGLVKGPSRVGASWQNPYFSFYKPTVLEELEAVTGGRDKALAVLRAHGLEGLARRSPFTLSMGQARLLSIVLASAWGPEALLVDEPTTGLGRRERLAVARLIGELSARIPVVIASHDLDFVLRVADHVVVMDSGRIITSGPALDVLYSDVLYEMGFPEPPAVRVGRALGVRLRSISECLG